MWENNNAKYLEKDEDNYKCPLQFDLKHVVKCPPKIEKKYWGKMTYLTLRSNLSPELNIQRLKPFFMDNNMK